MKRFLIIIAVLALLVPGVLLAQDEVTLKDVSTSIADIGSEVADLAEQVAALVTRVEAVEELFADPWAPSVIGTDDGICLSELHASHEYGDRLAESIHQETADAYRAQYGTSIAPTDVHMGSISFATEGAKVYLEFVASGGGKVVEEWANCEYLGHSEWVKE